MMELLWLPFTLGTIFLCGVGQVLAKESRSGVSSADYTLLFGLHVFLMFTIYWVLFHESASFPIGTWLWAAFAASLSGFAYVVYYESMKHGKISIVGTVAGAYAPWTVILALVFLGESLSVFEMAAIALTVLSVLLFTYASGNGEGQRTERKGLILALCAFFLWGTSAVMAKDVLGDIGNTNFLLVFGLVNPAIWTVYWLASTKGKLCINGAGIGILELSLLFLALGGITLYVSFDNGPVSIVSPVTNLYPIVTVLVAKVRLKEKLTTRQYLALAMLFACIPLFAL